MTRRTERVNELIRQELSDLLKREVKDPRLGGIVSVTEVDTAPDLKYAKVFVSVLGTEQEQKQTLEGLRAAAGFLRKELGDRLSLRHVPELSFREDRSIAQGDRILRLIREVSTGEQKDEHQGRDQTGNSEL